MRPKIILMSHGNMAEETLRSAEMIAGPIDRLDVVSMKENDGLSGTMEKLEKILQDVAIEEEILVIADLKGGTPCNVAMMKMNDYPRMSVVSGLNLAMVIEAHFSLLDKSSELAEYVQSIGSQAVENIKATTSEFDTENDDIEEIED